MESAKFVGGFRKCKRITQTVSRFRIMFVTKLGYEQLKATAATLIYGNAVFKGKDLTIVSRIHEHISKHLLTKSMDDTFCYFGNTTPNKFNTWSHSVDSVWKYNIQHIANLV